MNGSRRAARSVLTCALLWQLGCKKDPGPASVERGQQRVPSTSPVDPQQGPEPARAAPKHHGPIVKTLVGALDGVEPLAQGERLDANRVLSLKAGGELTLDFARGARVVVRGPAQVVVGPRAEEALLLKTGTLSVDLPPSAPTEGSGFWLATPSARLELVRGGRLVVRAFSDGSSAAFVVSGSAHLAPSVARRPAEFVAPGHGLRVALDGRFERTPLLAPTLEDALSRGLKLLERPGSEDSVCTSLDQSLAGLIDQVAAGVATERNLVAAHRQRIGTPAALSAQAAVAANAADLSHQRARLRSLLSQRAAARLLPTPGPDDALGLRAEQLLLR